jgi:hypothetical protein
MRAISLAGLTLLATACYGSDAAVYTPAGARVWNDGYPAAVIAVPPGAPTGTLEVASFGLVELAPEDMPPLATLHVRIAAANHGSDRPWNVDLAGATLRAGGTEARTLLANSDLATLPIALVDRGEPRTFDLYFAVPPGVHDEDDLPELDFSVQLDAGGRTVQAHTHFTRRDPLEVAGPRREAVRVAGWGRSWWADPAHPWPTFHRRPGIATPKPPARAAVNRLPRWQRAPQPRSAWR